MRANEKIAILVTTIILVAVPLALLGYERVYVPHKFGGARVVTLTALASDGVWTQDSVSGINYWRRHFPPAAEIRVRQGETVALRLASADVLHSFAIPALNIGPIDVPAGEVREVQFTAKDPDTLLCCAGRCAALSTESCKAGLWCSIRAGTRRPQKRQRNQSFDKSSPASLPEM